MEPRVGMQRAMQGCREVPLGSPGCAWGRTGPHPAQGSRTQPLHICSLILTRAPHIPSPSSLSSRWSRAVPAFPGPLGPPCPSPRSVPPQPPFSCRDSLASPGESNHSPAHKRALLSSRLNSLLAASQNPSPINQLGDNLICSVRTAAHGGCRERVLAPRATAGSGPNSVPGILNSSPSFCPCFPNPALPAGPALDLREVLQAQTIHRPGAADFGYILEGDSDRVLGDKISEVLQPGI